MKSRMKILPQNLLNLLSDKGFTLGPPSLAHESIVFVRPSQHDEVYESIIVDAQGRDAEAVYANIGVAITRQPAHKLIGDTKHLIEMDECKDRNWTIIHSDKMARLWEQRLSGIAPKAVAQWSDDV